MFYDNPYFLKDFPLFPLWFSVIEELTSVLNVILQTKKVFLRTDYP